MNSASERKGRLLPSDALLLAQIIALPMMKPAASGQVIAADVLFVILLLALSIETVAGLRRLRWIPGFGALLAYVGLLAPSLLVTSNIGASLFKLATEFYLVGLAAVTAWMIDSEAKFRRALLAWLVAAAILSLDASLSLVAFVTGRAQWLLNYSSFGFGSLPPGTYPRLALTFLNANMACNYLTVALALTFVARSLGYVDRTVHWLLVAGIGVASLSTISPGLGGVALLAGIWVWAIRRDRSPSTAKGALLTGTVIASLFVVALAFTPFPHPTAPYRIDLPGGLTLCAAPRLLTWTAALKQFLGHPLIGIGIGIDPVHVGFASPSGFEVLTDAHNLFLSIAAQCGVMGLVGLAAIIGFAVRRAAWPAPLDRGQMTRFLLAATFLNVLVYQGLGGSFEDTRHIWVLLGLLLAADRIDFIRADESNRRAGAPSPC